MTKTKNKKAEPKDTLTVLGSTFRKYYEYSIVTPVYKKVFQRGDAWEFLETLIEKRAYASNFPNDIANWAFRAEFMHKGEGFKINAPKAVNGDNNWNSYNEVIITIEHIKE